MPDAGDLDRNAVDLLVADVASAAVWRGVAAAAAAAVAEADVGAAFSCPVIEYRFPDAAEEFGATLVDAGDSVVP